MKWTIPIVCVTGALVIALGANIGVWYGKSKQAVVEPVEIGEPTLEITPETVVETKAINFPQGADLPAGLSLTVEEIQNLPYDEQPLEAHWYKIYTKILQDPKGYSNDLDYTPVVPFILDAMKKGYLVNRDYKVIAHEMNKLEAVAEIDRARELIKEMRDELISELERRESK